MRLIIAAVGKLKDGAERELYARYAKRVTQSGRGLSIGPLATIEISESRLSDAPSRRDAEAKALRAKLPASAHFILLEATGSAFDSRGFAAQLAKWRDDGREGLAFLIGGADGHGEALREKAKSSLSLGPMTLPHGLARIVLAEQTYRALTILSGHPYHRA